MGVGVLLEHDNEGRYGYAGRVRGRAGGGGRGGGGVYREGGDEDVVVDGDRYTVWVRVRVGGRVGFGVHGPGCIPVRTTATAATATGTAAATIPPSPIPCHLSNADFRILFIGEWRHNVDQPLGAGGADDGNAAHAWGYREG